MGQVSSQVETSTRINRVVPFIAADVGGTYARLGVVRSDERGARPVTVSQYRTFMCADYPSLSAIVRDFVNSLDGITVRHGAIASAGYLLGDMLIQANLPWEVSLTRLREDLGFRDLSLINDFAAIAYGSQYLAAAETANLSRVSAPVIAGPQVVMGPGTGLGAAVLIPGRGVPTVLTTEAGQAAFAPSTDLEIEILKILRQQQRHVSIESVLSGPGLVNLYGVLATMSATPASLRTPEEISIAGLTQRNAVAAQALEVFCGLMGSVAGDFALHYGAHGGVYLAGGILPRIKDFLLSSRFMERFVSKGPLRTLLERVPVKLIEQGRLGVVGAACWYLDTHSGE